MKNKLHPTDDLAQFIADGEPSTIAYQALRSHLASCPSCQVLAEHLRMTEDALHSMPLVGVSPALRPNVAMIIKREQASIPEWKPFPKMVWIPTAALLAVTVAALVLAPAGGATPVPISLHGSEVTSVNDLISELMSVNLNLNSETLLTIGSAVASILGGAGLLWSLSSLNADDRDRLHDMNARLSQGASHWLHPKRD